MTEEKFVPQNLIEVDDELIGDILDQYEKHLHFLHLVR